MNPSLTWLPFLIWLEKYYIAQVWLENIIWFLFSSYCSHHVGNSVSLCVLSFLALYLFRLAFDLNAGLSIMLLSLLCEWFWWASILRFDKEGCLCYIWCVSSWLASVLLAHFDLQIMFEEVISNVFSRGYETSTMNVIVHRNVISFTFTFLATTF